MHQQGPEHQEMQMDTVSMHGTEHRDEPRPETAAPRGKEGAEVHHGGCIPCSFASSALQKALQGEKGQDMVAGCPHQCCKQPQPQDTHNVDKGSSKATERNPPNLRRGVQSDGNGCWSPAEKQPSPQSIPTSAGTHLTAIISRVGSTSHQRLLSPCPQVPTPHPLNPAFVQPPPVPAGPPVPLTSSSKHTAAPGPGMSPAPPGITPSCHPILAQPPASLPAHSQWHHLGVADPSRARLAEQTPC